MARGRDLYERGSHIYWGIEGASLRGRASRKCKRGIDERTLYVGNAQYPFLKKQGAKGEGTMSGPVTSEGKN